MRLFAVCRIALIWRKVYFSLFVHDSVSEGHILYAAKVFQKHVIYLLWEQFEQRASGA